ncbi:MAG: patatin-like phospholipase family protein [Bacteroidales bacterium]|jgi:NTE family protein|nr:patatin-like phospholipase family protein [Bacteroidales bacterium]
MKIGLALGGGAVLGAAHVGALKALEEKNISVDYITGTSIGAFVGALFAFGKTWEDMVKISSELKWIDISAVSLSRYGLLSNKKLGDFIIKHIGDKNIEDADIDLAIVATDVSTGEKVVFDKGSVVTAVLASTCIPGIFMPIETQNLMLVDGGVVENVPTRTLKERGAEYLIGVDLNAMNSYKKPENILDVILNSFHFIMKNATYSQTENVDLLIQPDLSAFNRSDMNQVKQLIEKGYEATSEALQDFDTESKNLQF